MATKSFVINALSNTLGISKKGANAVFQAFEEITYTSLKASGSAIVPGVGRLKLREREARNGRNPKTGEVIQIGARRVFKLAPSKSAKLKINT